MSDDSMHQIMPVGGTDTYAADDTLFGNDMGVAMPGFEDMLSNIDTFDWVSHSSYLSPLFLNSLFVWLSPVLRFVLTASLRAPSTNTSNRPIPDNGNSFFPIQAYRVSFLFLPISSYSSIEGHVKEEN